MVDDFLRRELAERGIVAADGDWERIAGVLGRVGGEAAWGEISRGVLRPSHDFALHAWVFERCYGEGALLRGEGAAWFPSAKDVGGSNIMAAAREVGVADYAGLHLWSVANRAGYWELAIRRLEIRLREPYSQLLDAGAPTRPRWLVGARLNIVESCFQADPGAAAVVESEGTGGLRTTSYAELRALVNRAANALTARGVGKGDAVGMIAPMSAAAVATYLGVIAAGAVVVSIADSFAAEEVAARLRIGGAKLVVTQDVVAWGGKRLALYEKVASAAAVPVVVIETQAPATPLRDGDQAWTEFLSPDENFTAVACDPHDAINILFSSGTTGEPKAIPWDHTTSIKCAADAHFHHDLHPGDVACWPTNLGWMMGPWLIFAALINRGTMALHGQAPHDRAFGAFVQAAKVTMLGLVPSLVRAWRESGCMRGLDWSGIKAFSSSGECSNASDMLYLMHLAGYRPIIEYCGGTEIGGGYVTSTLVQPNIPAAFSTAALGLDFVLLADGKPARTGEVFLVGPSLGLSTRLVNRDHDAVYFASTPAHPESRAICLRRHGDELELLPNGYYRVAGRSDDTMNLGGIKVGCAEIERVIGLLPDVRESAAIAVPPSGGGPSRLVVFTVLRQGSTATAASLKPAMQQAIRNQLNPLFRVEEVRIVDSLPRTASNKVLRRELRVLALNDSR